MRRVEFHFEENAASGIGAQAARGAQKGRVFDLMGLGDAARPSAPRMMTGIGEFDRVSGGGFVPGSVLLLGGEPGIGKSTLLIQACALLAQQGQRVVYISGEEAVDQVRLRAERLGLSKAPVELAAETSVEDILATLGHGRRPSLVVINSIQTMWTQSVESAPGTVTQVRALGAGPDSLCQNDGRDRDPRRPCHQGRPDRGAARRRTYGRCGDFL